MEPPDLAQRFAAAWSALGLTPRAGLFPDLAARYGERHRAYHNLRHLAECFDAFDLARALAERPAEIELALFFHDAVYSVRKNDNEEKSGDWARSELLAAGAPPEVAERVRELVLATRHDAVPEGIDAGLLVDADLAILGASRERYDEYEAQIRKEYAWVPGFLFRTRRVGILHGFLTRPRIYTTDFFAERLEEPARENLYRALVRLRE